MFSFKKIIVAFTFIILSTGIRAQDNPDSIPVYELQEISVEASRMVRKADMDVYHPSKSAVENSANGMQLLTNIAIPSLFVDEVMGKISASGNEVQLRINGRIASTDQVRNLSPESVKRVEWIDNPGLRYGDVYAVLNFIVTNPDSGGSLMLSAQPMTNVVFGNYNLDLKLNHGKSQWSAGAFYKPCTLKKVHRQYFETFRYPAGEELTRNETPLGGKVNNYQGWAHLSYSYVKPDTTIFYATLSAWSDLNNLGRFYGLLSQSDQSREINLLNETSSKGVTPTLSLYFEQHFKRNQTLLVDFSSSLFIGYSSSIYRESYPDENDYLSDIYTYIKDFNQSYGVEADYIKDWEKSKLTAGISYTAQRNRSKYRNLDNEVFHQRQDKLYLFGEYFRQIDKFTLTAGLGVQYTDFMFTETHQGSSSWNLRPKATITYSPNARHQFKLNFYSNQISPALSETNLAPQQTDNFQWNIGNPDLKTYNSYGLNFRYSFSFWRVNANFNILATKSPKAIAPYLYWESDKLITSYENSKGKESIALSFAPQIQLIPDWLTISGQIEYLNERTRGTGYKCYNHNWNGNVSAFLTHWNFTFLVQYERARRSLWGEKLSWGEDMSVIALVYKWNDWQFGALMFMPFGKYDQGSKMLSKWNTNEYHLRLDFRMIGLTVNYNLQWGKQKRGVNKLIDADSSVEKSSAKSR